MPITVVATDPSGVNRLTLSYSVPNATTFTAVLMTKADDQTWSASIPVNNNWPFGNLRYHVVARDGVGNLSRGPVSGDETITVTYCIG